MVERIRADARAAFCLNVSDTAIWRASGVRDRREGRGWRAALAERPSTCWPGFSERNAKRTGRGAQPSPRWRYSPPQRQPGTVQIRTLSSGN